jgi:hypothetical protein
MAIITTNTRMKIGYDQRHTVTAGQVSVSNANGGCALPFKAQFTGTITRIAFCATVFVSVTNLQVGIMLSNAAGSQPSDTYIAAPNIFAQPTSALAQYVITLTNPIAVVKGQEYWIVFRGNGSLTGNIGFSATHAGVNSYNGSYRPSERAGGAAWSRTIGIQGNTSTYGSSTKWYTNDYPIIANTASSGVTCVTNQEYGVAFTLNANHPAIRISRLGTSLGINANTTTGSPNMFVISKIYNAAGTLLYTFDTEDSGRFTTTAGNQFSYFQNRSGADIWLEPATKYYIMTAFSGTFTGTAPIAGYYSLNIAAPDANGAYTANYANRSSGGVITEITTSFLPFWLDVDGIRFDNSSGGGGGGYVNASSLFRGGFNG